MDLQTSGIVSKDPAALKNKKGGNQSPQEQLFAEGYYPVQKPKKEPVRERIARHLGKVAAKISQSEGQMVAEDEIVSLRSVRSLVPQSGLVEETPLMVAE